jgi:hypothetical protein
MRDKFAIEWYKKGEILLNKYEQNVDSGLQNDSGLLFESYIYLWIALTVAAKEYCARNGVDFKKNNYENSTDKEEILHWVKVRNKQIIEILKEHEQDILELCSRTGSKTGTPIMDVYSDDVIKFHDYFISYWEGENKYSKQNNIVKTFILILNRVRNNLFHGGKSFSVKSDCEILRITCPILKRITLECINTL